MKKNNPEWGNSIKHLLEKHQLTIRGAALKAQRPSLRTYLSDWLGGHVPQYDTAVEFLSHFPREEAIECLKTAGYPPPPEWNEEIVTDPLKTGLIRHLALMGKDTPDVRESVYKSIDRILRELGEIE